MSEGLPISVKADGLNAGSIAAPVTDLTQLLGQMGSGQVDIRDELYRAVYAELRAIAARKMASERPDHTLQPTALVHEAWLRFGERSFTNRAHFFAAAAEVMRHILVDNARRKRQRKRGGDLERVELLEASLAAPEKTEELLMVNEALDTLARADPLKADIVKLRYFVGLNHQEIAEALGLNEKTVRRHWEVAKVRLYQFVSQSPARLEAGDSKQPGRADGTTDSEEK
jgi:RNA polymerase sigma factor (TIGR02999 family)